MKRIIMMLVAVCFCFGLCTQTSVSEAARWQTYYTAAWGELCQIDLDSVERVGENTYRFWDRRVSSTGEVQVQGLYECNIAVKEAGYGYGTERVVTTVGIDGELRYECQVDFNPVLVEDDQEVNRIVYLNHAYGDGTAQLPNWTRFHSNPTTVFRIDVNTISKKDGIYSAWVQEHTPMSKMEAMNLVNYKPYEYKRFDYKQDEQGELWIRRCDSWGSGDETWHPAQIVRKNRAEHEFQFLKEHLG